MRDIPIDSIDPERYERYKKYLEENGCGVSGERPYTLHIPDEADIVEEGVINGAEWTGITLPSGATISVRKELHRDKTSWSMFYLPDLH